MILEFVRPKKAIALAAGVVGLAYDRLAGVPVEEIFVAEDDLTRIDGIGRTFAARLNAAGVTTFAHLANLTPEQVKTLSGAAEWQGDPSKWIAQAKILADSE
ncbi:MAG: DUF4332 domain-containing protein [Candidatus Promineifilaceae bacterium]|nr:DUF4332 domain-containing protein [Candidatus Promineifilaceae bacterium]